MIATTGDRRPAAGGQVMSRASKVVSLATAADLIEDGQMLAFGGSLLHRGPFALARELARQNRRGLQFVKPSPAYDVDLLCAAGYLSEVQAGVVTFEAEFGLAPNFRRAVESGQV